MYQDPIKEAGISVVGKIINIIAILVFLGICILCGTAVKGCLQDIGKGLSQINMEIEEMINGDLG